MFGNFISNYGMELIAAILTFVGSMLGLAVKSVLKDWSNDKKKKEVVKTVISAVQQLYSDLDGPSKYEKAVANITEMLNEKGIGATELEIQMMIEDAYRRMKIEIPKDYSTSSDKEAEHVNSTTEKSISKETWVL